MNGIKKTTDFFDCIGRKNGIFDLDISNHESEISKIISKSSFLILGGAGTIGMSVTKEIFQRKPKKIYVVDISENNLVELVRDLRSSYGFYDLDFKTFALDIGSSEYDSFINSQKSFDYVLNLSALKHVRSEKDRFTLMRLVRTNIFNTEKTLQQSIDKGTKKYFCVSTDKAANPVNLMGASKKIMEFFLHQKSHKINISSARFANVAFSDGSLLYGFEKRLQNNQPIAAPSDIKRYFVSKKEAGQLCLMSCIYGNEMDIFFPKLNKKIDLINISDVAKSFVRLKGYEPFQCKSEKEARLLMKTLPSKGLWPCFFSKSDTTGEKSFEEFFTISEEIDNNSFKNIGIVKKSNDYEKKDLSSFKKSIDEMLINKNWTKENIIKQFKFLLPSFKHHEKDKFLDDKM